MSFIDGRAANDAVAALAVQPSARAHSLTRTPSRTPVTPLEDTARRPCAAARPPTVSVKRLARRRHGPLTVTPGTYA